MIYHAFCVIIKKMMEIIRGKMKILFIGDIVGSPGRKITKEIFKPKQ